MSLGFDPSDFTIESVREVLLTIVGKLDKKAFVKRAQQRGYVKKGTKRRSTTEEERFDGCFMEPVLQKKE
jgi:hypothetical protein